jgi:hypothetical protein
MEKNGGMTDRGKPKNSKKNLSQCHFAHHKSHMDLFLLQLLHKLWPALHKVPKKTVLIKD